MRSREASGGAARWCRSSILDSREEKVPHVVSELAPAALELGLGPRFRAWREALGAIPKPRHRGEHFQRLLGILLPIGGDVQVSARTQARRGERRERRLEKASLVVALLRPGIGEKDVDAVEGGF